jgi:nitrite reductase/ring-hydroxylating ferredoxin subunit
MAGSSEKPLTRVGVYQRTVRVSIERVWENVHDWAHLPWLHGSSFSGIECLDSGPWGWRARVGLEPAGTREILLELVLDDSASRYVSRTLEGEGAGSEIWTSVQPLDAERTQISVEFWLPDVDPARADRLGESYTALYIRLWDEDESMMVRRSRLLAARSSRGERRLELGPLEALRARLPLCVELSGRPFRLLELDGELVAHAARCPHLLGPLEQGEVRDGVVTCPWHGYRFDVRTGRSRDGRRLRLDRAPRVELDSSGGVVVSL